MIRLDARKPLSATAPAVPPADDDAVDFGALFHLGLWGGIAAACLLVVAIATRTETGQTRLAAAYSALTGNTEVEDRRTAERDRQVEEARRTAETIRNLTQDRDRLLARMTALERNYEDVTGSIGKLANVARSSAEPAAAPSAASPVATAPAAAPVAGAPVAPVTVAGTTPAAAPAPAAIAVAPSAPEPQEPVSSKGEFGVDIGGAPTLAAMRTAWDRIRRNHASLLEGLRPVIAVRDGRAGQVDLRLIVGPIGNAAAAAKLCASLAVAGLSCQPTVFEGQRLASR